MPQTKLKFVPPISTQDLDIKIKEFLTVIDKVFLSLSKKFENKVDFESVICRGEEIKQYLSESFKAKPESFTRENIVEEFLDFLGYGKSNRASESQLAIFGRRYPDYKLIVNNDFHVLVEAEPLNTDLTKPNSGINQVIEWITHKACTTNYGIATDGFKWVLVEFSLELMKHRIIKKIDLSSFFAEKFGVKTLLTESQKKQLITNFIVFFSKNSIQPTIEKEELQLELYQEEISKKFYDSYMQLVFGDDRHKTCFVNSIQNVRDEESKKKIAQIVIDRLIFIKFIEAKGWLNKDKQFLLNLWKSYKDNPTISFYDSYLKVLFFNVLNNPNEYQKKGNFTGIKYLNGGLFRKIPEEDNNTDYTIGDDILAKIIEFLESYTFGDEQQISLESENYYDKKYMSPEILGYIFERTANHQDGAYYTPSNVTAFMTNGTVLALICDHINTKLKEKKVHPIKRIESLFIDCDLSGAELKEIYEYVKNIKILDPACGSGAFFMPSIGLLLKIHKLFLSELELPFDVYKIKKLIIENNIFGVEINEQAVEIAKLRLWLDLVSSVNNFDDIDLLPSIEYNIMSGNSLVGFEQEMKLNGLSEFNKLPISDWLDVLESNYQNEAERIRELAESPAISNLLSIKDILVRLYKSEREPKVAVLIKKIIEKIHIRIQEKMNDIYKTFINLKLKKNNYLTDLELERIRPFHWIMEFDDILRKGGFDVIIGNPPYVEHSKIKYPVVQFKTEKCGNIYAPFFERAIHLCKEEGYFAYIVPISSICTDRMNSLQQLLIQNTATLKVSNFDDRPDKIFKGLEDCRSSIIFGTKNINSKGKIYSTNYFRWYADEKEKLFSNIKFVEVTELARPGVIPKIGHKLEVDILKKINSNTVLSKFINNDPKTKIVFHNAPRYWIRAMDFMPEFSNSRGDIVSSQNKEIYIKSALDAQHEIAAVLNSSLFYWFFITYSDCRHLNLREIENFPFDVEKMKVTNRKELKELCIVLMKDYKKNSKLKKTKYKTTGKVVYREFYPGKSKLIIDRIDDVLAEHYNFTEEEKSYIKNFDLRFRMGENKDD